MNDGEVITISKAIDELEKLKELHGDIKLHLEVDDEDDCPTCGGSKSTVFCGMCIGISTINIDNEGECVWLYGNRD